MLMAFSVIRHCKSWVLRTCTAPTFKIRGFDQASSELGLRSRDLCAVARCAKSDARFGNSTGKEREFATHSWKVRAVRNSGTVAAGKPSSFALRSDRSVPDSTRWVRSPSRTASVAPRRLPNSTLRHRSFPGAGAYHSTGDGRIPACFPRALSGNAVVV